MSETFLAEAKTECMVAGFLLGWFLGLWMGAVAIEKGNEWTGKKK
jgi:hypothetical protein